jgi:GTP cyclohydrolase II
MEQGRGNTSAIPHEMLGTRTETMRTAQTGILWRVAATRMPTKWGMFSAIGFEREVSNGSQRAETALAIVLGELTSGAPLLRIHSQCFTGEVLGSLRCDCNDQLEMAMKAIATEGRGLVIYEYQEGRGIGLMAKLQAYELQDAGIDTVQANHALGFKGDCRDFSLPAAILHDLGIKRVRLLTNNPRKAVALADAGIEVVARISCEVAPTPYSLDYLQTKKEKMGHALSLRGNKGDDSSRFGARGNIFRGGMKIEQATRAGGLKVSRHNSETKGKRYD